MFAWTFFVLGRGQAVVSIGIAGHFFVEKSQHGHPFRIIAGTDDFVISAGILSGGMCGDVV